jgi:hypothetical protein
MRRLRSGQRKPSGAKASELQREAEGWVGAYVGAPDRIGTRSAPSPQRRGDGAIAAGGEGGVLYRR